MLKDRSRKLLAEDLLLSGTLNTYDNNVQHASVYTDTLLCLVINLHKYMY